MHHPVLCACGHLKIQPVTRNRGKVIKKPTENLRCIHPAPPSGSVGTCWCRPWVLAGRFLNQHPPCQHFSAFAPAMAHLSRGVREDAHHAKTSQAQAFRGTYQGTNLQTRLQQLGSRELARLQPWITSVLRGWTHQNRCKTMPRMMKIIDDG